MARISWPSAGLSVMPMTLRRTVPSPTYEETLSGGFAACRQSRYSAKLFHVHGTSSVPARPERCFFQSALSPSLIGARDMPSSPRFSVVTPCMILQSMISPARSGNSEWLCPSTKPGQSALPSTSSTRRARAVEPGGSTAATVPPSTPTSP